MEIDEKYIIIEREHYYNLLEKRGLMKRSSIVIGGNNPKCDPGEMIVLEKNNMESIIKSRINGK